jgi:hypothetical protein
LIGGRVIRLALTSWLIWLISASPYMPRMVIKMLPWLALAGALCLQLWSPQVPNEKTGPATVIAHRWAKSDRAALH